MCRNCLGQYSSRGFEGKGRIPCVQYEILLGFAFLPNSNYSLFRILFDLMLYKESTKIVTCEIINILIISVLKFVLYLNNPLLYKYFHIKSNNFSPIRM